jgi:tRNA1(Val) A37 N6-methylase TrmN6
LGSVGHAADFLKWFLFHSQEAGQFDGVVGNPPFIRYQYLPEEQKRLASRKNCPLQTPPMELQFCQDENGRSNH